METNEGHQPCPVCPSSDAFHWQNEEWGHCFSCGTNVPRKPGAVAVTSDIKEHKRLGLITDYETQALKARGIDEETCRTFNYGVGLYNGKKVQIAPYYKNGKLVAQKIRGKDKRFTILGDGKALSSSLFGSQLWAPHPNKRIVVCEGEIDALSVLQAQGKWPCVSVPTGAQGAAKAIQANNEFLEGFKEVVFCFDQDEAGIASAKVCADLITPGKARIATLPDGLDPNDVLRQLGPKTLVDATWNAKVVRPDGVLLGEEMWELMQTPDAVTDHELPWSQLNAQTKGLRKGEITLFCAGSGAGKSTAVREIAKGLIDAGKPVGYIALEESSKRSMLGFMSLEVGRPLHLETLDPEASWYREAFDRVNANNCIRIYDHWGSMDQNNLMGKIKAMHRGFGCDWIVLDHISIVVSGLATEGDERKMLDVAMTKLRSLAEELKIGILLVAHLKRRFAGGTPFERGGQINMSDLRGSAALEQMSDTIVACERDQQDEKLKHFVRWRVVKCRFNGDGTGLAGVAKYNIETGRLDDFTEQEDPFTEHEEGNHEVDF